MVLEGVEDDQRALALVFEVGGVHEDELVVLEREADLLFEDGQLVAGVLVEPDLADAQNVGLLEEFRDNRDDLPRETGVVAFLRVDADQQ